MFSVRLEVGQRLNGQNKFDLAFAKEMFLVCSQKRFCKNAKPFFVRLDVEQMLNG